MEAAWKEALRVYQQHLRAKVTVANFLHDCRKFLTDAEYSRVDVKSKAVNESSVDELIEILLSKEYEDFVRFCSALRANGCANWAVSLEEEAKARKNASVSPGDQQSPAEVEHAWGVPPKAEKPATSYPPERTDKQSWGKGA